MKGFLKGLSYISQIFQNEKEPEIQIGFPTDVKHVAHIGWDGPSVSPPSWMNEFTTSPQSSPSNVDSDGRWVSEGSPLHGSESSRRGARGIESHPRDLPEIPKTRRSTRGVKESQKTERSKQTKQSLRNKESSSDGTRLARSHVKDVVSLHEGGSESPSNSSPTSDIPKKSRRKKSKDSSLKPASGPKAQNAHQAKVSEPGPSNSKASNNMNHTSSSSLCNIDDRQRIGVVGMCREC